MTYSTASEVLIREDLSGYLSNLEPAEIPLQSTLGRIPVTQKMYEYGVDRFSITRTIASIASNARAESAAFFSATTGTVAATNTTEVYPTRLHSIQQINSEAVLVSGTDRVSVMAGISDPFEYRIYKTMVKVANDQEMPLLWGTGTASTTDPRQTQGLVHWCAFTGLARTLGSTAAALSDVDSATTGNIIPPSYWSNCYNAGGNNLDLSMLTDKILGAAVDNGFRPAQSLGMCGRKVKSLIAGFALTVNGPLNHRHIAASDNTINENVTFIETASHGTVGIFYNRYFDLANQSMSLNNVTNQTGTVGGYALGSGLYNSSFPCNETLVFFMPEYVKIATLRGLGWGPLPRLMDGDAGAVVGEQGLVVLNPVALTGGINLLSI